MTVGGSVRVILSPVVPTWIKSPEPYQKGDFDYGLS
jgi:hypothetical protein